MTTTESTTMVHRLTVSAKSLVIINDLVYRQVNTYVLLHWTDKIRNVAFYHQ